VKSRLESWRNGFASNAMQAIDALVRDNAQTLTTKDLVAQEISMHLASAELKVTPDHMYKMFAYQWSDWSEDPSERKVRASLPIVTFQSLSQGFGKNPFILYTLANAHLAFLDDTNDLMNEKPIGTLIMSMQAVSPIVDIDLVLNFFRLAGHSNFGRQARNQTKMTSRTNRPISSRRKITATGSSGMTRTSNVRSAFAAQPFSSKPSRR
jgi:hypothetical protein